MSDKICNIKMPQYTLVDPEDEDGCIKPRGHLDAHQFITKKGAICEWEFDYSCTCGCNEDLEEDSCDPCILYTLTPTNNNTNKGE